jgi:tetratricopeptide (TPR) repeat protein
VKRLAAIAIAVGALYGAASAQPAKTPEEQAGELVDEAIRHYNVGEYAEAIDAYKAAYKLVPEPTLLWNIAQAYRLAGDCPKALTSYRSYVREAPAGEFRAMADQRIPEMEECAKKASPPPPPPPPDGPPDKRLEDPLGNADGTPRDDSMMRVPVTPPAENRGGASLRLAGYAGIGAGAIGLAVGGYFTYRAHDLAGQAEDLCRVMCAGTELQAVDRDGDAAARNGKIFVVAGGVLLTAGIVASVISRSRGEHRPAVTLLPTPQGATASAAWTF